MCFISFPLDPALPRHHNPRLSCLNQTPLPLHHPFHHYQLFSHTHHSLTPILAHVLSLALAVLRNSEKMLEFRRSFAKRQVESILTTASQCEAHDSISSHRVAVIVPFRDAEKAATSNFHPIPFFRKFLTLCVVVKLVSIEQNNSLCSWKPSRHFFLATDHSTFS